MSQLRDIQADQVLPKPAPETERKIGGDSSAATQTPEPAEVHLLAGCLLPQVECSPDRWFSGCNNDGGQRIPDGENLLFETILYLLDTVSGATLTVSEHSPAITAYECPPHTLPFGGSCRSDSIARSIGTLTQSCPNLDVSLSFHLRVTSSASAESGKFRSGWSLAT
jgi:hypothetical protein